MRKKGKGQWIALALIATLSGVVAARIAYERRQARRDTGVGDDEAERVAFGLYEGMQECRRYSDCELKSEAAVQEAPEAEEVQAAEAAEEAAEVKEAVEAEEVLKEAGQAAEEVREEEKESTDAGMEAEAEEAVTEAVSSEAASPEPEASNVPDDIQILDD